MTGGRENPIPVAEPEMLEALRKKIADQRVPFTGTLELTHRCQLRCVHCYGGDQSRIRRAAQDELNTDQWTTLLHQAAEAGCVDLLLTGGEPLLRPDFSVIYEQAKRRGFVVTIFTNGIHLTDELRALFFDWPPFLVEITIYGCMATTHDRVTQVPGSFRKTIKNIERLLASGVRVGLKTVLMWPNVDEAEAMERLAASLGVPWRLDAAVFSCLARSDSGGKPNRCASVGVAADPASLRISPQRAAAIECSHDARRQALRKAWDTWPRPRPPNSSLYTCGAGLTGFHIDPYGWMQPCLMVTRCRANAAQLGFQKAWEKVGAIRKIAAPQDFPCARCDLMPLCSGCPALFDLENGDAATPSGYICLLAKARHQHILGQAAER